MTIAVVYQEGEHLWCAADTRVVAGPKDDTVSETASKIIVMPVVAGNFIDSCDIQNLVAAQYGFVFAGATAPALQTAVFASNFLQALGAPGAQPKPPPSFEQIAEFVQRLAYQSILERRQFGADALFSAGLLGWCLRDQAYKVAHLDGRDDSGSLRVELTFPKAPEAEAEPWLILGSGKAHYERLAAEWDYPEGRLGVPKQIIRRMVAEQADPAVGGALSQGRAYRNRFDLFWEMHGGLDGPDGPPGLRIFNNIDLDRLGTVGDYHITINGNIF